MLTFGDLVCACHFTELTGSWVFRNHSTHPNDNGIFHYRYSCILLFSLTIAWCNIGIVQMFLAWVMQKHVTIANSDFKHKKYSELVQMMQLKEFAPVTFPDI